MLSVGLGVPDFAGFDAGIGDGVGDGAEVDAEKQGYGLFGGGGEIVEQMDFGAGGVVGEVDGDLFADGFAVEGGWCLCR